VRIHISRGVEFVAYAVDAFDEVLEFESGGPAGGLAEAAVRGEGESIGWRELEACVDAIGDVLGAFEVIAFDIDDTDGDVLGSGDVGDEIEFGEFAAGHFEVDFVDVKVEESGEHGCVTAEPDRAAFVVAETEVSGEAAASDDGFDGAVEEVDEAFGIFDVGVAAHGRFIERDFVAAGFDEGFEFGSNDGEQGFGEGESIGILMIGQESSAQGVGTWNAGFEGGLGIGGCAVASEVGVGGRGEMRGASVGEPLEAQEIGDCAEATRGAEFARDAVASSLVMGGGAEATLGRGFELDAIEETVEGKVEIEAGLFAIGDDIEAGFELVMDGDGDGVVDGFIAIGVTELVEVKGGELEPAGQGIASDDGGAKWARLHSCGEE
jgi:hypothetical protein